jgi:hypothetical protein
MALKEVVLTAEVRGSHKRLEDYIFASTGWSESLLEEGRRSYNYRGYRQPNYMGKTILNNGD